MASIHRRPASRFWHAAFRDSTGKLQLRSTKLSDRRKALITALEFERAARLATEGVLVETQARRFINELMERVGESGSVRSPSIEEALREWLALRVKSNSSGTFVRYEKVVNDLVGFLQDRAKKPLVSLTPKDVQGFIQSRLTKDGCSPSTANIDGKILRSGLNYARKQGLIPTNPAEAVLLPGRNAVERGTFTPEEVRKLVEVAEGEWKMLITIAYFTGMRLSDCCRLEWKCLDLQSQTLLTRIKKTNKTLFVPIHTELNEILSGVRNKHSSENFVMPGMAAKGPGGKHGLSEGFKRIVNRANLDLQRVQGGGVRKMCRRTFHALRHSFASALANAGVSPEVRMKLTGHTTEAAHKTYTHHEIETLRAALNKVATIT